MNNNKKNVLIAAHGNSLRAIMIKVGMYKPEEISSIELPTGSPLCLDYQNGELIREGNTIEMLFNVEKIVKYLSTCMTLFPGDIILTGAPPRVREKIYLSKGDTYSVSVEGLEEITTKFI